MEKEGEMDVFSGKTWKYMETYMDLPWIYGFMDLPWIYHGNTWCVHHEKMFTVPFL